MNTEEMRRASFNNRDMIKEDTSCSCYFCMGTFKGSAVVEWVDDGTTALCPLCEVDTVLPVELGIATLASGCERWFTGVVSHG